MKFFAGMLEFPNPIMIVPKMRLSKNGSQTVLVMVTVDEIAGRESMERMAS